MREQRQDVDVDKVLQSLLATLIRSLEREADAERHLADNIQRLRVPGCRSDRLLHHGDLIYIKPDSPVPYVRFVRLAVLRRLHRSGCKVDVQLCDLNPLEMGTVGVDRIRLAGWMRGLPTTAVLGAVEPRFYANPNSVPMAGPNTYTCIADRERSRYPRELWPTLQLWNAAELAMKASGKARRTVR